APEFVNLRAMQTLRHELGVLVGFSDHTIGDQSSALAVALGACMIEKHLTLDRKMKGSDHVASTEPKEFKEMVTLLKTMPRNLGIATERLHLTAEEAEIFLGSAEKKPQKPELQ